MTFISTDGESCIALSLKNKIRIYRNNQPILTYINSRTTSNDEKKQSDAEGTTNFVCHGFSRDQSYFAALTDDKKLLVWDLSKTNDVQEVMKLEFPKRPTSLSFLHKENGVIVSDKYGDVYKCVINEDPPPPKLVLGHLSMVLDVEVTEQDKYIISADRDEKIRISHYPHTYSIHTYCLGHKNLVSCIKIVRNNRILSTSGDKTLKLWNYIDGNEIFSLNLSDHIQGDFVPTRFTVYNNQIILIAEKFTKMLFLEYSDTSIEYKSCYELSSQPMDICCRKNGDIYVIMANRDKQVRLLSLVENKYIEKDSELSIDDDWKDDLLAESKYLSNLVKPTRSGKRDSNEIITPEATINFESVYENGNNKKQKIEE